MNCDVAIIGGGPAGSTVGSLLKKYNPALKVSIFEAEQFPRDHVGESQLPALMNVLVEMGVWDKVEAANFPIKIGGTYVWGRHADLWDLEFIPGERFVDQPRPAKFVGQRAETAFQVDRSIYDKVLLDHAASLGCEVYEATRIAKVNRSDDRVTSIEASDGQTVRARHYVDASGNAGILRKTMEIPIENPTALQNIALYEYWQDADWAVTLGNGGTRIQVISIGWGWIWFIPITETRTSVGLVVPAKYYKASGKSTEELYAAAIAESPFISGLLRNAKREGKLHGTRDWSFIADRLTGENWILAGDTCGFADPILSAGLTLAQTGSSKVATCILELDKGSLDPKWIRDEYEKTQRSQIRHHIRFADYWYTANGRFTDLRELCSEIAKTAGLDLGADDAFRWLATGGFALEDPGVPRSSTFRVGAIKYIGQFFSGEAADWVINRTNVFRLNLEGASKELFAFWQPGRIRQVDCYRRNHKVLPLANVYSFVFAALQEQSDGMRMVNRCVTMITSHRRGFDPAAARLFVLEALESLIAEGWVTAGIDESRPFLEMVTPEESTMIHRNRDNVVFETVEA
ncbi:MAG TPA: NAD(P)/FAD-dependent oxidoreductase [Fimbriimonas sp.]|nr:NAD(P)/FAD-dependent oxidoreductase [Fimbriimonas sp.]